MKTKIKMSPSGEVTVIVPYKHGKVTWRLMWNGNFNYTWQLVERVDHYNPNRVRSAHLQMLNGKQLRGRILRTAAACHLWHLHEQFKKLIEYKERVK